MIEAMACGTPVVAFNRGAAPEIVRNGETGYVVDTIGEMLDAVNKVHDIDAQRCREHVERNFNVPRLADDYLAAYQRVMTASRTAMLKNKTQAHEDVISPTISFDDRYSGRFVKRKNKKRLVAPYQR